VQKGEQDPVSARTLSVIQPNFRYAYREYFDDYTHVAIFTHVSLCDVFRASGFDIIDVKPRFLPLSIKSGLPVRESLIRAYLASPIKPMGFWRNSWTSGQSQV
jgi:hypothetical protein